MLFFVQQWAFAGAILVVAAAGSSRSEPVPELTNVDELTIRGTILAINAAKRTEAALRRG